MPELGNPLGPHQWNVRLIDFTGRYVKASAATEPHPL